jgi:hypothetical protein
MRKMRDALWHMTVFRDWWHCKLITFLQQLIPVFSCAGVSALFGRRCGAALQAKVEQEQS